MRRLLVIAVLALSACAPADDGLRVLAASSLTDAFTEVAGAFEASAPGTRVTVSFAGSAAVREQVLDGIRADVVAVASPDHLGPLNDGGLLATSPVAFATNVAVIGVPADNPAGITGIVDLGRRDIAVGVCAETVPCGTLAAAAFAAADIEPAIATEEPNVRSLVAKIAAGELDAGIVYRTDALASNGEVTGLEIDDAPSTAYLAARLTASSDPALADRFIAFLGSSAGREILARHGFGTAP